MNRAQKIAWFNLIVVTVSLIGLVAACLIGISRDLFYVLWFLGALGPIGLSPILFRKKRGRVSFDERDALIRVKAWLIGLSASYGSLGGVCIAKCFEVGLKGSVPAYGLLAIWIGGLFCFVVAKSLMTLFLYGGGKGGKENE